MKNTITFEGQKIDIGVTPVVIEHCGFKSREEVRKAAIKYSEGEPLMKMGDVAEWFKTH